MRTRIIIILTLMLMCPYITTAQQGKKVIYGQTLTLNDLPVSGITITAKKAKSTAVSDSLGNFVIVCNEKDNLAFKAKVFHNKTVKINAKTPDTISVSLHFVNSEKNVDIAIGYGYIKEKHRTQAVEYSKSNIDFCSYSNIYDVLRNHFPTLQVQRDGCVIIRGPSSINTPICALYVVDGMKMDNIDFITPCQVKEISVLKDASAAAIYGCESANGVIIINMKTGGDSR